MELAIGPAPGRDSSDSSYIIILPELVLTSDEPSTALLGQESQLPLCERQPGHRYQVETTYITTCSQLHIIINVTTSALEYLGDKIGIPYSITTSSASTFM